MDIPAPRRGRGRTCTIVVFVLVVLMIDLLATAFLGLGFLLTPLRVTLPQRILLYLMAVSCVFPVLALVGIRRNWREYTVAGCVLLSLIWLPLIPVLPTLFPDVVTYEECMQLRLGESQYNYCASQPRASEVGLSYGNSQR